MIIDYFAYLEIYSIIFILVLNIPIIFNHPSKYNLLSLTLLYLTLLLFKPTFIRVIYDINYNNFLLYKELYKCQK